MINEIEIIDYKGFKNLKLDNLSQINVISGENNVGKTALLEALYLEIKTSDFYNLGGGSFPLLKILKNRNISRSNLEKYLKNFLFKSKSKNIQYKYRYELNKDEKEASKEFREDYEGFIIGTCDAIGLTPMEVLKKRFENEEYFSYINSSKPIIENLVKLYSPIQSKALQHKFLTYLKLLDNDIEWIEPQLLDDEMLLRINLKNPERSLVSSELGEGTNRYIEILATLLSNSNGTVFIDEIENGIHYTKLYDVWKAIIEIVQKEEIQLFVTTHDRESIEALAEASQDMNFNQITSIKLEKNRENSIYPIIRTYSSFSATVDSGMDIR